MAEQAGKCPRRGRVTQGKSTCLRVLWSYGEDLMGPHWGWSSPPECSPTTRFPQPLWKASRENEKCLHLQGGFKGGSGSVGPLSCCPCVAPHTLCALLLLSRCRYPPAGTSTCPQREVGKQRQDFTAYFSQTVTLGSQGTNNSEQPGHFPDA